MSTKLQEITRGYVKLAFQFFVTIAELVMPKVKNRSMANLHLITYSKQINRLVKHLII